MFARLPFYDFSGLYHEIRVAFINFLKGADAILFAKLHDARAVADQPVAWPLFPPKSNVIGEMVKRSLGIAINAKGDKGFGRHRKSCLTHAHDQAKLVQSLVLFRNKITRQAKPVGPSRDDLHWGQITG